MMVSFYSPRTRQNVLLLLLKLWRDIDGPLSTTNHSTGAVLIVSAFSSVGVQVPMFLPDNTTLPVN